MTDSTATLDNTSKRESHNTYHRPTSKTHKELTTQTLTTFYKKLRNSSIPISSLQVPNFLYNILFDYQKETLGWLYNLYKKQKGGVIADEMGLGKTVQIIAFISSMLVSGYVSTVLVVAPSTILNQWVCEWKKFFPFVRVVVLHKTHSGDIDKLIREVTRMHTNNREYDYESSSDYDSDSKKRKSENDTKHRKRVVKKFSPTIVLISYDGFKKYHKKLNEKFQYLILDEGHKIKNKDTVISKEIKRFKCHNKIVLTGTPIQNNLKELWAIFDFVSPGLLGSFTDFIEEFEDPIKRGGYAGASKSVEERAYKRSVVLRSLIEPHIIRRLKCNVSNLPGKMDKVVFVRLNKQQEIMYRNVIGGEYVYKILTGKINCLGGILLLRRICNHPYLVAQDDDYLHYKDDLNDDCKLNLEIVNNGYDFVYASAKMSKLDSFLREWIGENKKVLIFTQMLGMIQILEQYFAANNYTYLKMDGSTPLKERTQSIDRFNSAEDISIFLLTTRVGGLGLNLVAASRVIIYDPDWNPGTDSQARERAWRYGQKNEVITYRFITADTIEEKIYKRQIFKTLLSSKVLKNPSLSKFFEGDDLNDLFSYNKTGEGERVEDLVVEDIERDGLEFFKGKVDGLRDRMEIFKDKEILDDGEMIEFIRLREEFEDT